MAQLSELELLKASRNPLRVIDDLYKEALEVHLRYHLMALYQ